MLGQMRIHRCHLVPQIRVSESEVHHRPACNRRGHQLYQHLQLWITVKRSAPPISCCDGGEIVFVDVGADKPDVGLGCGKNAFLKPKAKFFLQIR